MGFCTSCGVELQASHFCTSCGAPVVATSRVPAHATSDSVANAPRPGPVGRASASPVANAPWVVGEEPRTHRRALPRILAVAALLLATGATAVFIHRSDNELTVAGSQTPASSASAEEPPPTIQPTPSVSASAMSPLPSASASPHAPPQSTPFHVVVLASKTEAEGGRAAAEVLLPQIEAAGFSALVFPSETYASLRCCYWVAAAGPFPDAASAKAAIAPLRAASSAFSTAYDRCIGTTSDCPS